MIFSEKWLSDQRQSVRVDSWASRVMEDLHNYGEMYLDLLRKWYESFPLSNKQKRNLKARIESAKDEDHLGAVNELTWWAFMQWARMDPNPIPTTSGSRPDFFAKYPVEFFCEVSTLNLSKDEKSKLQVGQGVPLNHPETVRRVLGKMTDEKEAQLAFALQQKKPCVLVIFDYTEWSGYQTQFFRFLADVLLGKQQGVRNLPAALSALVYVEDQAFRGRIRISSERSAVYYNSRATHPLPESTFPALNQYWGEMFAAEAGHAGPWICL
jgi:hypothetical protein